MGHKGHVRLLSLGRHVHDPHVNKGPNLAQWTLKDSSVVLTRLGAYEDTKSVAESIHGVSGREAYAKRKLY